MLIATSCLSSMGCGRKGDPIPRGLTPPSPCTAHWIGHRTLGVRLPLQDGKGKPLMGLERVRIYYLPLGSSRPSASEVLASGEVIQERSRPDLPAPGGELRLELKQIGRPAGWIVAIAVRVGEVMGAPSEPIPWLDPAI